MNKIVRVATYVRCSTDEQAAAGHYGLAVQEDKLKAFCKSQVEEYQLAEEHIYRDEGFSGSLDIQHRPGLTKLFEDAAKGEFDVVLVYRLDRFFRNTRHLLNALEKLKAHGIAFQSATESFNTAEISGRLLLTFLGGIAEAERETIAERTISGKLKSAREGKWVTGVPPYGFQLDKETKKLVPIPQQAKIVKKLFRWVVDERLPLREIERRMNLMKVPPPYNTKYKKKQTLNYWHKRTIGRILTNEVYTGDFFYRKYRRPFNNLTSISDKRCLRPKEDWIPMHTEAIITKEMFEAAKEQLLKNRELARRNQKRSYAFGKILYCGGCGYKLYGGFQPPTKKWPQAGGRYYHGVYKNDAPPGSTRRCAWCPTYAETRLEPIWNCLKEILRNPKNIFEPLGHYIYKEERPENIKEKLEQIETALASASEKQGRVDELYINGQLDQLKYKEKTIENSNEEKKLHDEAGGLRQMLLTKKEKVERQTAIQLAAEKIKVQLENLTYEEKSEVILIFIERITLYAQDNHATVVFRFPRSIETTVELKGIPLGEGKGYFPLVLDIRTMSLGERQAEILKSNPRMYVPKSVV